MRNVIDKSNKKYRWLVLAVSLLIAAALIVTGVMCFSSSRPVDVNNPSAGEVQTSGTARGAQTGATLVTNVKNGTYVATDYFDYTSAGQYNLQLVPGEYKLEAWGAQGGSGTSSVAGGLGGYTYATYTVTTTTTIYFYVGGAGVNGDNTSSSTHNGGANGGGATTYNAGSGGGATHFATQTGALSAVSSGNVLIVAGGGGGSQAKAGGIGGGGNVNGGACSATSYGSGGCGGGTGGPHGAPNSSHSATTNAGSYGQGGAGSKGGDGNCGGGGGGGYYGGCGVTTDGSVYDDKGGGGGSGYIKSGLEGSGTSGTQSGGGKARITINSLVNNAPTTLSLALTGKSLGTVSETINASSIAEDPDATVNTAGAKTTVYFQTLELYTTSACTTTIKTAGYMDYTMTSSAITVSQYKKLPRTGTDSMANNTLTVYCKIKDNFTQSVATSTISFTISFSGVTVNRGSNTTGVVTGNGNSNTYRFGNATINSIPAAGVGTALYGSSVGAYTVTVEKPIKIGDYVAISAAALLTGYNSTYYAAYIVPGAAAASFNYTSSTTAAIFDFTSGQSYTQLTGYSVLRINGINPAPSWQRLTCTLYLVEKSSAGATNREPTSVTYSNTCQTIEINFRVDNTRPVLKSGYNNVVDVAIGTTSNISLATIYSDADETITASTHSIKAVKVPTYEFVQLDKYGNIVSTANTGGGASTSYYNKVGTYTNSLTGTTAGMSSVATGFNPAIAANNTNSTEAFVKYSFSGITLSLTGLRPSYSQYADSRAGANQAATAGSTSGSTATGTLANPGHFYLLVQIEDKNDTADTGIWRPIAITVSANTAPVHTGASTGSVSGQSTVANRPTASGGVGATFYFTPMAVNISGTQYPIGKYKSGSNLVNTNLRPLTLDGDNFTKGDASNPEKNGVSSWNNSYNEFVKITSSADAIKASIFPTGGAAANNKYFDVELINIYVPTTAFNGRVRAGSGSVPGVKYMALNATSGLNNSDTAGYYVTPGIKITLKSTTYNRYLNATVALSDSAGSPVSVNISVRVNNTAPTAFATGDSRVATFGNSLTDDAYSTYENASGGIPTLTYKVPLRSKFFLTPYDIIRDYNASIENGGDGTSAPIGSTAFTLNGLTGSYANGMFTVGGTGGKAISPLFNSAATAQYRTDTYLQSIKTMLNNADKGRVSLVNVSTGTAFTSAMSAATAYKEKLFFTHSSDPSGSAVDPFTYNASGTDIVSIQSSLTNYIELYTGNSIKIGNDTYSLDFLMFEAVTRTIQSGAVTLTVRDRSGNSVDGNATLTIRILIDVVNTAPAIKDASAKSLKVDAPSNAIVPNTAPIDISDVMQDDDNDTLYIVMDRGLLVANTNTLTKESFTIAGGDLTAENLKSEFKSTENNVLCDSYGNLLTAYYVSASIRTSQSITVTALGSTKNIPGGVFVYFYVTDNRGGTTLGYKQIEVVNTAVTLHRGDDGFNETDGNVWNIDVARASDITLDRYIVGSQTAESMLKSLRSVRDENIKVIADDADSLSGVLLAPVQGGSAVNLEGAAYANAVPNIKMGSAFPSSGAVTGPEAASVMLFTQVGENKTAGLPDTNDVAEMLFYVEGTWYDRDGLITALESNVAGVRSACFDSEGRWILKDFALRLRAARGMNVGQNIGILFSIADEAKYGGYTADKKTAYTANRGLADNREKVVDRQELTVYLHISQTGIITKDAFAAYDNHYVVDVPDAPTGSAVTSSTYTQYLATYDGDVNSALEDGVGIYYEETDGVKKLTDDNDETEIKSVSAGGADNTLAGVYSGVPYSSASDEAKAEGYVYPDTIVVPSTKAGNNYNTVYVPMSYFGMLSGDTIATDGDNGEVIYAKDYVTYDVRGSATGSVQVKESLTGGETIDAIANTAITLTDETGNSWGFGGNAGVLSANPYVTVNAVNYKSSMGSGEAYFGNPYSAPYFNRALSVPTVNNSGNLLKYVDDAANNKSFVGDGRIMYLEQQTQKLLEHNFGLSFTKNQMRTGAVELTLTVKLVKADSSTGRTKYANALDANTVSVRIRIENDKIDLVAGEGNIPGDATLNTNKLRYDEENKTYYYNVPMATATSQSFALVRDGATDEIGSNLFNTANKIYYKDDDYRANTDFRDYAYFASGSTYKLGNWGVDDARTRAVAGGALANTINVPYSATQNSINSILNYYGVSSVAALADVKSDYQANKGKYGSNNGTDGSGNEGYSSYFSLSYSSSGRVLNIMANRKTHINETELKNIATAAPFNYTWTDREDTSYGGLKNSELEKIYLSRGFVAKTVGAAGDTATEITEVYYPLKIMIYDDCGGGWGEASYTAVEFRISISNATPTFRSGIGEIKTDSLGEYVEYGFSLAVGGTVTLNLYDFINDPDIYTTGSGMYRYLATEEELLSSDTLNIARETGDYLLSPLSYSALETDSSMAQAHLLAGTAGFSLKESSYSDVTMWMNIQSGGLASDAILYQNTIGFTVHRRTTTSDGSSVNEFRFTLTFKDNNEEETGRIVFRINVVNQAPRVDTTVNRIRMRAGDSITLLTAYYDTFVGGSNYTASPSYGGVTGINLLPINHGTTAYGYSRTLRYWNTTDSDTYHTNRAAWNYPDLLSSVYGLNSNDLEHKLITDTTTGVARNVHMGYLGVATDDTPWTMRIDKVEGGGDYVSLEAQNSIMYETSTNLRAIGYNLKAVRACTDLPVVFTINDGENGTVTYTIYVTIVSSPPVARDGDDAGLEKSHLEGVPSDGGGYIAKTFRMFTMPSGESDIVISGIEGTKRAYNKINVAMMNIAYDPDGADETNSLALYNNGMFTVNDEPMTNIGNTYYSDYFTITVDTDRRSFVLEATGYNQDEPYETLKFLIGDSGNNVRANTLEITIYVYTVFSDMQNPTASAISSTDAYNKYLEGSEKVNVKAYDAYYGIGELAGTDSVGEPSKFAFVKQSDNIGNDGNTASPIVDPDVSRSGLVTYGARLYAFIDDGVDGDALTHEQIAPLISRNAGSKTLQLTSNSADSPANQYLIGGIVNGEIVQPTIAERYNTVTKYVEFSISADGTYVLFVPKTATLNKKLLLYIEVEKSLGRGNTRDNGVLRAGAFFSLVVEDSKPRAYSDMSTFNFEGVAGESVTYSVYDSNSVSLFVDSDRDDDIRLDFNPDLNTSYETALASALEADPDLDWEADEENGKDRAFDIILNGSTNTVTIKINRRMDKLVRGKYAESVTFPIVLTGVDLGQKRSSVTIMLTISNTPITARNVSFENFDPDTRVGYSFRRSADSNIDGSASSANSYEYLIEARVIKTHALTVNVADFLSDADYRAGRDNDSYRFVGPTKQTGYYDYLVNSAVTAQFLDPDTDSREDIARIDPIFTDDWHYTGFTITALSTKRELSGTVFLRIIDRAGDNTQVENGITIRIDITVMNDRPYLKENMNATTLVMLGVEAAAVGQDQKQPESKKFSIADYVMDNNDTDVVGEDSALYPETYLRIYSLSYLPTNEIYSTTTFEKPDGAVMDASQLFNVVIDTSKYNQEFTITPIVGFYGNGALEITVSDGDKSKDPYALDVTFRINVQVVYDPANVGSLKTLSTARGKTMSVSIDLLVPDIQSTIGSSGVSQSAAGETSFNPSPAYTIVGLELAAGTSDYIEVVSSASGVWSLRARKVTNEAVRVNVRYALKTDLENVYSNFFMIDVVENNKPSVLYPSLTFTRFREDAEVDPLRTLDTTQTIYLRADQLLHDPEGDVLRFMSVSSQKPSLVSVSLNADKTLLAITFNGRGSAKITMEVADETDESCVRTFIAKNEDLPSPSFWVSVSASFESNKIVWAVVIGVVLLLIVIIVLLISRRIKRKHDQEELEALIVSEMAIEEQMNKLAAGPTPTDYQSYGYLPPTAPPVDPRTMIGGGVPPVNPANALPPTTPVNDNFALNPGQDPNNNNGNMQ